MSREAHLNAYRAIRQRSLDFCAPMEIEDMVLQTVELASPPAWALGHTTWFFEQFLLDAFSPGYEPYNRTWWYLFNSYYVQAGPRNNRSQRGWMSRPTVREIKAFRAEIDNRVAHLIETLPDDKWDEASLILRIGMNHEQQHQELLVTDHKANISYNPLRPAYDSGLPISANGAEPGTIPAEEWVPFEGGMTTIGYEGDEFFFDNERPVHQVYVPPFKLRSTLVSNREYLEFMEDGGYENPALWLSDGWATVNEEGWDSPLYWEKRDGQWMTFTLAGMKPVNPDEPVTHVSHFEADAFAAWKRKRLPTEFEWEHAARTIGATVDPGTQNWADSGRYHPAPIRANGSGPLHQLLGDVWEWTGSAYLGYPGYYAPPGAIGEYNGKFMSGQMVLRGGSCATPANHFRISYRNFFYPQQRWQFTGIRLATEG